ncbi:MAG: rRNA maturation RNase YbeY [Calditrichaceae bacterium]
MEIQIHQLNPEIKVTEEQLLNVCDVVCSELEFSGGSCNFIFVDDSTLSKMHDTFLNDPEPTDVITFDLGDDEIEGEVYISFERAIEHADFYSVSPEEEIVRLMIHGLLHLKGYDDRSEDDQSEMKTVENHLVGIVKSQVLPGIL